MCIVCVDLIKQSMTVFEAERNLKELTSSPKETSDKKKHYWELRDALNELDVAKLNKLFEEAANQHDTGYFWK